MGITERAAQGIVKDLVQEGYLRRIREGRRNKYLVRGDRRLRHPVTSASRVALPWNAGRRGTELWFLDARGAHRLLLHAHRTGSVLAAAVGEPR